MTEGGAIVASGAPLQETYDLRAGDETGVKVGEISWAFGVPLVAVRDVFVPERIDAWGYFPGKAREQPVLRMTIEVRQGIPSFTRFEVTAASDGVEITGAHLGLVRDNLEWWRDMIVRNAAQRSAARVQPGTDGWDTLTAPDWADSDAASGAVREVRRGRPRKATDARHERVAMIYKAHLTGRPLEAIRDAFRDSDGNNISRRTAARYVSDARKAGYLPATSQGMRKA